MVLTHLPRKCQHEHCSMAFHCSFLGTIANIDLHTHFLGWYYAGQCCGGSNGIRTHTPSLYRWAIDPLWCGFGSHHALVLESDYPSCVPIQLDKQIITYINGKVKIKTKSPSCSLCKSKRGIMLFWLGFGLPFLELSYRWVNQATARLNASVLNFLLGHLPVIWQRAH